MSFFFSEWLTNSNCSGSKSSSEGVGEGALDLLVEDDPPDRGQEVLVPGPPVLGLVVQFAAAVLVDELGLLRGAEHLHVRAEPLRALARLQLLVDLLPAPRSSGP